ncbi:hypothetical protein F5B18DRAFT_424427 [Nemania serpens]|nr:hypothetical protein F5B18DRAFT_424427 [Nemania serpens]
MPFIYVEDWKNTEKRQEQYNQQTELLALCVGKDSSNRRFLEGHMPTTLDEYCSPALPETILKSRNMDQVLGRYERFSRENEKIEQTSHKDAEKGDEELLHEIWLVVGGYMRNLGCLIKDTIMRKRPEHPPPSKELPTNVVFVGQAWIWKIGEEVIITRMQEDISKEPHGTLRLPPGDNPDVHIALMLDKLVERLDRPAGVAEASLLTIYENALLLISEKVNKYTEKALVGDIDIDQEKDLFYQISDLYEEVLMIKSVLFEQEDVWEEFMRQTRLIKGPNQQSAYQSNTEDAGSLSSDSSPMNAEESWRTRKLLRPRAKFSRYKRRIAKLQEDAKRVEENISTNLNLKQKHATIREAHAVAILGATVFGFTIITVIFSPLSFIVALFALPIDKFNEGRDGNQKDGLYSSSYIGKWSGKLTGCIYTIDRILTMLAATVLVSIAVTLVAMLAALWYVRGKTGLREYIRQKANNTLKEEKETKERDMKEKDTKEEVTKESDRQQLVGERIESNRTVGKKHIFRKGRRATDVERAQPES